MESRNLNMKYNDLLSIFLETKSKPVAQGRITHLKAKSNNLK
jgi:hypothetical protein